MKHLALLIAISISLVYGWNNGVVRYSADDISEIEKNKLMEIIIGKTHQRARLGAWSYKNCEDVSSETFVLTNLTLGPDPLSFPGDLTVALKGVIKSTLDAPLSADVVIEKKIGGGYIKIPCIGIIGSCHYDDLCEILSGATCPEPFVTNHIPCKCPFTKGSYTLPTSTFSVDAAVFPPGEYRASANLTYGGNRVSCVSFTASII